MWNSMKNGNLSELRVILKLNVNWKYMLFVIGFVSVIDLLLEYAEFGGMRSSKYWDVTWFSWWGISF